MKKETKMVVASAVMIGAGALLVYALTRKSAAAAASTEANPLNYDNGYQGPAWYGLPFTQNGITSYGDVVYISSQQIYNSISMLV